MKLINRLAGCVALAAVLLWSARGSCDADCFTALAQTRNFTLGLAQHALPLPDGRHVLYLESGPRDTEMALYEYDSGTRSARVLARPSATQAALSVEEKARRQRARMTLSGITDFAVSDNGRAVLITEGGRLFVVSLPSGAVRAVSGDDWIAPRLSPDGRKVAAVRGGDLHVVDLSSGRDRQLTYGGTATVTYGLAEFVAAEELDRADGSWWSPDSGSLMFERSDTSGVEPHFIADPLHPSVAPVEFRYPRAGTSNARLRFGIIPAAGGAVRWIQLDDAAWPYVARVIWPKHGPLSMVVLNRAQTHESVLAVDPHSGHIRTLLSETDPNWIDITSVDSVTGRTLPDWLPDGSGFLWAAERGQTWQLELRHLDGSFDHAITPPGWRFDALDDVDMATSSVVVTGNPQRTSFGLYRVPLGGGAVMPLSSSPGFHQAQFSDAQHRLFADSVSLADGRAGTMLLHADASSAGELPSQAAQPPALPDVHYLTVGARGFDALVLRPAGFVTGRKYPVVLSVYAGPGVKMVIQAPRRSLEDQCLADHGFIVASLDGRGTPGRNRAFKQAIKGDLIDVPLADQVAGLQALAARIPEMDMSRVGVAGWSFGGYFSAMAAAQRPDVFKTAAAGAPVVNFADYDTAYTERYLGTPQSDPAGYTASDVLTYAHGLSVPLLIMHGLTDDNVYFENTMKLTQALLAAGKRYRLLLLPGTHLLTDPVLRAKVDEARAAFLSKSLAR